MKFLVFDYTRKYSHIQTYPKLGDKRAKWWVVSALDFERFKGERKFITKGQTVKISKRKKS